MQYLFACDVTIEIQSKQNFIHTFPQTYVQNITSNY